VRNSSVLWVFILFVAGAFLLWQLLQPVDLPDANMSAFGSETVRLRVTEITVIAILFALRADSLGQWRPILGPEGSGDAHIQ